MSSYQELFFDELSKPDNWMPNLDDVGGAVATRYETYFEELGGLAKKLNAGELAPSDAIAVKQRFEALSKSLNAVISRVANFGVAPVTADDFRIQQYFKNLANNAKFLSLRIGLWADVAATGDTAAMQKVAQAARSAFNSLGGVLGLFQMGTALYDKGTEAAGKAGFGVIGGLLGAKAGVAAGTLVGATLLVGAPVLIVAAATVGLAVGAGFLGSQVGEADWEPFHAWYTKTFLPSVFDASSSARTALTTWANEQDAKFGVYDGTWLQGFALTPEQKAEFSRMFPSLVTGGVSEPLKADLLSIFQAPFAAGELLERDKALQMLVHVAQDLGSSGYATALVAVDGNQVAIDIPPSASRAREALRQLIEASVMPSEQAFVSPTLPAQMIISLGGGTRAAGANGALMAGSSTAETLNGGAGADTLIGAGGVDELRGGASYDTLFGGEGNDTLIGGTGSDWLLGGNGNDTYHFAAGDGSDTLIDADGLGTIWFQTARVTGGKKATTDYWISDDKQFGFTRIPNADGGFDLIVTRGSSLDQIRIRNWQPGRLGIALDDAPAFPPRPLPQITGDFVKAVNPSDPRYYLFDALGNYVPDPIAGAAAQPDLITGSAAGDELRGSSGNDGLAGFGGDDVIEGGVGSDLLMGGLGRDVINGGDGNDEIFGSGSGGVFKPIRVDSPQPAAAGPEIARGFGWVVSAATRPSPGAPRAPRARLRAARRAVRAGWRCP